jgi:hypothetical protein
MATDVLGTLGTQFSPQYLALQDGFCCDTGNLKVIKWVGCKPGVYLGSKTLFTSDDLAMCNWFQAIDNYAYSTIDFEPGGYAELELNNHMYFYSKLVWEKNSLESLKQMEFGFNQQGGVIGSTIPFNIGVPVPERYNYTLVRTTYSMNTSSPYTGTMRLNNCSPYNVSVSMLYAY